MPDKIPARGWKSQGKYPPRTTLPRTRHTSGRNDLHLGIIYQTVSIDYDRLFFGNMSFVHDIRRAELMSSLVHDIRREEMICIDYLFERSEFLIDTPHKKNLRVCPCAACTCQIILVLVCTYVSTTYVRTSARYQPATKIRICIYVCARVGYVLCATYVRKLV